MENVYTHPEPATNIDWYQLSTAVNHFDKGLLEAPATMSFFVRRMPSNRDYLVWAGLRRILMFLGGVAFNESDIQCISDHPLIGRELKKRPRLVNLLRNWHFKGNVRALREGTIITATKYLTTEEGDETRIPGFIPFMELSGTVLDLKLLETPLLSIMNQMMGVATTAHLIVKAAGGRPVVEAGQRRTGKDSSADASYAAYIGGVVGTSNVRAFTEYGIPGTGTMDHFAIQAWERPGVPHVDTEREFFQDFIRVYGLENSYLLVDTYDSFGATGIRNAVAASDGKAAGIRLDSYVNPNTIALARGLLDILGARNMKIVVSGGLNASVVASLWNSPVDMFLVGENMALSTDSPVTGAVGKLCCINGVDTMKYAAGMDKMSYPGELSVEQLPDFYRINVRGEVAFEDELKSVCEDGELKNQQYYDPKEARKRLSEQMKWLDGQNGKIKIGSPLLQKICEREK